jgi:hypothetical protein
MSGIGRVLAGVLLAGAVGGAAAFARESGSDPTSAPAIGLTAPPPQHITAPGTVLYAEVPSTTLVAVVVHARRSRLAPPKPKRVFRPVIAAPPPVATPAPEPAVPPAPPPAPPRALAAVTPPVTAAKAHGRALGHPKQHGPPADPAQVPGANGNGNAWGHSKDRGAPAAD